MHKFTISEIENVLGYVFKDKSLIESAFTHSSFAKEYSTFSNERMEFLGDGILNFVIAEFLFMHRQVDEGVMSQKRAKIVSRQPLSKEVERLGLMKYLRTYRLDASAMSSEKFKSNLYEAAIAAIYLDGGMESAKDFIVRTLIKNIKRGENQDYKTELQIRAQDKNKQIVYKDERLNEAPPFFKSVVLINGEIMGEGEGKSKKLAQQNAARVALEKI